MSAPANQVDPAPETVEDGAMARQPIQVHVDGTPLSADRWSGSGPPVVLLHAGICDRRSWYATADRLAGLGTVVAYDRRGFGDSPASRAPYRDVDDLIAVLDRVADEPVWLVGSSMGGQVALDAALAHPDRVAGLVLLAPAVSGAPDPGRIDADTQRLSDELDAAVASGDLEEVNRLETWPWLDGPAGPEGRVTGPMGELALEMNAVVLRNEVSEQEGARDVDTWHHLEQIQVPTTVAWGDLDVPFLVQRCEQLTTRLPRARRRVLAGTAHLPYLEDPGLVADLVRQAVNDRAAAC